MSASENPGSALSVISAGGLIAAADAAGAPLSVPLPFQNKIMLLDEVRIAGTTHVPGIDAIVEGLEAGAELRFVRDPKNLADGWAIKVYAGDARIGDK